MYHVFLFKSQVSFLCTIPFYFSPTTNRTISFTVDINTVTLTRRYKHENKCTIDCGIASYALRQSVPLRGSNRHTNGLASSTRRGFHATGAKPMALLDTIAPWTLVPLHDALQAVHMGTGLPWYALIPLATVAMRTVVTLPVAIAEPRAQRKQVALAPVLSGAGPVLRARLAASEAAREGRLTTEQVTVLAQKEARRRRVELFRRHGCQVWKSVVLLPLVQMPVWVGTSLVVRAMCGWSAGGVTAIGVEPGFSVPAEAAFAWYPVSCYCRPLRPTAADDWSCFAC